MSIFTPHLELSSSVRSASLEKLASFQSQSQSQSSSGNSSTTQNGQTENGAVEEGGSESDAELALRLIRQSGRFRSEEDVKGAVDEYVAGKPLAYITGLHPFGDLTLVVRPPVYIPRVETEQWVLLLSSSILCSLPPNSDRPIRILDICSGSGCIPLLLAREGRGRIQVVGLDVDPRALAVARENATRNNLDEVARFEQLDLFDDEALRELAVRLGGFDMVVSNPPYVSSEDMETVEGKWHEGKFALQGKLKGGSVSNDSETAKNDDGYSFYRRILSVYKTFLLPKGDRAKGIPKLVLEVGSKQSSIVQEMYKAEGRLKVLKETERRRDIGAPKLEVGNMVGTERSVWVYEE